VISNQNHNYKKIWSFTTSSKVRLTEIHVSSSHSWNTQKQPKYHSTSNDDL